MLQNLFSKIEKYLVPFTFLIAVVLRAYMSTLPAQVYDIATYEAWGRIMLSKGPADFFATTWSDYLPLPIYFCSLVAVMADYLRISYGLVFKIMVSALEMLVLVNIWKHMRVKAKSLLIPLLWLSPALIGDSAWWGQLDTIPALLAVLSLAMIHKTNFYSRKSKFINLKSAIIFGIAVAIKPIMLVTLPVFLVLLWRQWGIKQILSFGFVSFLVFLLPAVPTSDNPLAFLISKALEQSSTYPYTTINGWNLWSILPLHNTWPPDDQTVLSVSAHSLGMALFGVSSLRIVSLWRKNGLATKDAFRVAGTLLIAFFAFTTRMHERHLLFGLPFLAVAAVYDRWLTMPFAILTATFTFNLWSAYYWVNHDQTWPISDTVIGITSWVTTLTAASLVSVWNWDQALKKMVSYIKGNRALVFVLLLSAVLRLYNLSYPTKYIFDEVYHSFTAREFLHNNIAAWEWWTTPPAGVAYEWTHPPVAKYGMVIGMLIAGENSFGWRLGSAVLGVICIMGLYHFTNTVFGNKNIALLAAFLLSIEGLHISQSRVGMNDMYMLTALIWALYNALKERWKLSAVLFGLALGSKWSAIYGVIPLALIYLRYQLPKMRNLKSLVILLLGAVRLVAIALVVYVLTFIPFIAAGHTWDQWWELHRQMWYYHTHLVATHAYQSTPYQWIFALRPVWYFVEYGTRISNIYAQGNPAILWLGLAALLLLLPRIKRFSYAICFTLYAIFTLPWIMSPRIMFFYHYLPSATFLCIMLAAWISEFTPRARMLTLALCVLTLLAISPMLYGFHMPPAYWDTLFAIFPSWK